MQKIIAILLITLVSSNTIIENNLKLRKTAEIELGQILDEIKEYKIEKNLSELMNFAKI